MRVPVPELRVRALNGAPIAASGAYVLYWMVASRRSRFNFALQRAADLAVELSVPLLVFEPLRVGYPWASDRHHRFVIEGMAANAKRFAAAGVAYYPYLEETAGADKGLLLALSRRARLVVTDDYPAFFLPRLVAAAAAALPVRLEAVDSNGLLPMRATEQVFPTAYAFRRYLQRELTPHLAQFPLADPLKGLRLRLAALPPDITSRWKAADVGAGAVDLSAFPIDHSVGPALWHGGSFEAEDALERFLGERLARYVDERSQPEADATSGLSPYLHFGHLSVHEVFTALESQSGWTTARLGKVRSGAREGFWNVSKTADAFLDELVTWRELGFNFASHRDDFERYESLPTWARATLEAHASDPRPHRYTPAQLEASQTHDPLWNAAQRQLVRDGYMHNYLRMLWGKKVLEWSDTPQQALATLVHLNNKYELDGRDPNSYSGIFWVFGRYDRPWGPERPIFGLIRYMSSDNTARKLKVKGYVARYGAGQGELFDRF